MRSLCLRSLSSKVILFAFFSQNRLLSSHRLVSFSTPFRDLTLPHPTIPHPTLPNLTSPHLTQPDPTLPYLTPPYQTTLHLTIPHQTLPHPTLPYLTPPYLIWFPRFSRYGNHKIRSYSSISSNFVTMNLPYLPFLSGRQSPMPTY